MKMINGLSLKRLGVITAVATFMLLLLVVRINFRSGETKEVPLKKQVEKVKAERLEADQQLIEQKDQFEKLGREIAVKEEIYVGVHKFLADGHTSVTLDGRTFSHQEVLKDADEREKALVRLKKEQAVTSHTVVRLVEALDHADKALARINGTAEEKASEEASKKILRQADSLDNSATELEKLFH